MDNFICVCGSQEDLCVNDYCADDLSKYEVKMMHREGLFMGVCTVCVMNTRECGSIRSHSI